MQSMTVTHHALHFLAVFMEDENDFPLDFRFNLLLKTSIIATPFKQNGYFPWHYCSFSPFHTKKAFLVPNGLFCRSISPNKASTAPCINNHPFLHFSSKLQNLPRICAKSDPKTLKQQ